MRSGDIFDETMRTVHPNESQLVGGPKYRLHRLARFFEASRELVKQTPYLRYFGDERYFGFGKSAHSIFHREMTLDEKSIFREVRPPFVS